MAPNSSTLDPTQLEAIVSYVSGQANVAKEAVTRGRLIFDRDHSTTATFEMYALSMYASLQEARREVLRAYAA